MNSTVEVAAVRDCAERVLRDHPEGDETAEFLGAVEEMVGLARKITAAQWKKYVSHEPGVLSLTTRICPLYGRYLRTQEIAEARRLLDRSDGQDSPSIDKGGDFARAAYARVADMFDRIDFSACRRFVMIGAGPLPVTLLHVMQRTEVSEIVGVDLDGTAIEISQRLMQEMDCERIRIEEHDGTGYTFEQADVIYVANLVMPKGAVLQRVAATARQGVDVILRNPHAAGHLFAEDGTESLDRRLTVVHRGRGNARFLSRHVFLKTL